MFQNAQNFVINGGHFTTIAEHNHDAVWTTLWHYIAPEAMFDSAERYPPGRCHPGTRQTVISKITNWIEDRNATQRILWLYGAAGSGKSSLMQSMCEHLRDSGMYAGSFFFNHGNGTKLCATLSYQLAIEFPSLRKEINDALHHDPVLPTKSINMQFLSLIINPLLRCTSFSTNSPIIIIDGLDECDDDQNIDAQRQIIASISKAIVEHNVPIRFMIASRPENWIRDVFKASPLSNATLCLSLRDDYVDSDIRAYLRSAFEGIRLENRRVMRSVELPWPPESVIERLVAEASGQFIYASTVLKFVGESSRSGDPQKQLQIITSPGPHQAPAFSGLEKLYATILSIFPRWETMKQILGGFLVGANLTIIEVCLGVERSEITAVLDALNSLINILPPKPLADQELLLEPIFGPLSAGQERIEFCHLSFREYLEFLGNETRSGMYCLNVDAIKAEIFRAFFRIIRRNLDQNYEIEPHVLLKIGLSTYNSMMHAMFAEVKLGCDVETLLPLITDMTETLQGLDPDRHINHPACLMQDMKWIDNMLSVTESYYEGVVSLGKHQLNVAFLDALHQLRHLASLARRLGIYLLSLCDGFKITPTLAFIDLSSAWHAGTPIVKLLGGTIPGISLADVFSTLQQHRHIIDVSQSFRPCLVDLNKSKIHEGWLSCSEWRNQRVNLVCECLKSIMNNFDSHCMGSNMKRLMLGEFFDDGNMSDIRGIDYFKNRYSLAFLSLMTDATPWRSILPPRPELWNEFDSIVNPVLCWFGRQLKNVHALRLMNDHDPTLPQKMKTTMTTIFQLCFVPVFTTPYFSELKISMPPDSDRCYLGKEPRSILIKMLSSMCHWEVQTVYSPPENRNGGSFHRVHDEIFGMSGRSGPIVPPIIDRSLWYPYLAAYLLNILVKYLYSQTYRTFHGYGHENIIQRLFPYILECLPYAEASQQNLDAFRAIKYFSAETTPPWQSQAGFSSMAMVFLKKYDHSILSPKELDNFELWLSKLKDHCTS